MKKLVKLFYPVWVNYILKSLLTVLCVSMAYKLMLAHQRLPIVKLLHARLNTLIRIKSNQAVLVSLLKLKLFFRHKNVVKDSYLNRKSLVVMFQKNIFQPLSLGLNLKAQVVSRLVIQQLIIVLH